MYESINYILETKYRSRNALKLKFSSICDANDLWFENS